MFRYDGLYVTSVSSLDDPVKCTFKCIIFLIRNRQYNDHKKVTERQSMVEKTLHRKLKIERRGTPIKSRIFGNGSFSTSSTSHATVVTNPVIPRNEAYDC